MAEMNNLLLAFSDSAAESGIRKVKPQLALKLEQTTKRFATLTRTSVRESEREDQRMEDLLARAFPTQDSDVMTTRRFLDFPSSSGDSSSPASPQPGSVRQPHSMGHDVISGEGDWLEPLSNKTADSLSRATSGAWNALVDRTNAVTRDQSMRHVGTGRSTMTQSLTSASPMLDRALLTPFTYSSHESTFGRRLHRASLEKAYCTLTSPTSSTEEISRIFGLCFFYTDVEGLVHRLC